jgi:hypothetical protein
MKKRRDACKDCGGPLYVLAWAKRIPRSCYGVRDAPPARAPDRSNPADER